MDLDEIIVPKAGEYVPQTCFPTVFFHLDTGPQLQSPWTERGLDLTRGEEETAERSQRALELLFQSTKTTYTRVCVCVCVCVCVTICDMCRYLLRLHVLPLLLLRHTSHRSRALQRLLRCSF